MQISPYWMVHCKAQKLQKDWSLNQGFECPELKNQNRGNQTGSSEARGRVYALGGGETNQDSSNIAYDIDA
ncbi:hypothetical protein Tco_0592341 [Tanacetum coccineum]